MKPARKAIFSLALQLGMTVRDLLERMTYTEFQGWCRYFSESARVTDPKAPLEIDWEKMSPESVSAMFSRK